MRVASLPAGGGWGVFGGGGGGGGQGGGGGGCGHVQAGAGRDVTRIPAAISTKATTWYQCGASPSQAADITAANTGVRLLKKAAMAGPTVATPAPQKR